MNDRLNHRWTVDGSQVGAHLRRPATGSGPGLVLVQEIFGISDYIAYTAERLSRLGYVVMAPDLYWRVHPGADIGDSALEAAMGYAGELDPVAAVGDVVAALHHLRGLDGVEGEVGLLGFCLGGALAYHAAATADPALCVSYYGSAIPDALGRMDAITCPTLFHFGGHDEYCPPESVEQVRTAAAANPHTQFEFHPDGGHAFDNAFSDRFYQPRSATLAWGLTAQFLERHLPVTEAGGS